MSAASEAAVVGELESRRLTPVSIGAPQRARRRGVSAGRLALVYGQLADLLHAGVPLTRSLELLAKQKKNPRLAEAFGTILEGVREGGELSAGMGEIPEVFPPVQVAMVRAGEEGGFLEKVLRQLAELVQRQADLRGKIISSLIYPSILMFVGGLVLSAIFGFLVPMFGPMFDQIEDLPAITSVVFAISAAVTQYGLWTIAALAVVGILAQRALKRDDVRRKIVEFKTRAPLLGPLVRAAACARFCRMLGTMEGAGVPLLNAMRIAKDAAGNILMSEAIDEAADSVRAGATLAEPLRESGLFEEDVIEMIDVGESAGNLDDALMNVARVLETRLGRLIETFTSLIGPVALLLIAVAVGLVAAALILPITQLSGSVG
jgi:general secretion pathway protein F